MSDKITVFFLGATGYIGGAVLELLLQDPRYAVTALVRDKAKADILSAQFGVRALVGAMEDGPLLTAEAAKADVIFNAASLWLAPAVQALLDGAKARLAETGRKPIFLHTSGAALAAGEDVGGDSTLGKVYDDVSDVPAILARTALPAGSTAVSGPQDAPKLVQTLLHAADAAGFARAYVLYPPCVWGARRGPLADARAGAAQPTALRMLVAAGVARGQGCVRGRGLNRWSVVEVHEYADLNKRVLEAALADPAFASGGEGHYFGVAGDIAMIEPARVWTRALHAAGKSRTTEPEALSSADLMPFDPTGFGMIVHLYGLETLCKATRGLQLGWKPVLGAKEFLADLDGYVSSFLAESGSA